MKVEAKSQEDLPKIVVYYKEEAQGKKTPYHPTLFCFLIPTTMG